DPFEMAGMMCPPLTASIVSLGATPKYLTPINILGTAYWYVHCDTKLYRVLNDSPYTATDVTAQVSTTDGATTGIRGAALWKGKYIYSTATKIFSNDLPVLAASEVTILNGVSSSLVDHRFTTGADGNLYFTDVGSVGRITNTAGTSGNTFAAVTFSDASMVVRHLVNDGRYLVILADNNGGTAPTSYGSLPTNRSRCQVLFWDMVKGNFEQIWELDDSYLIGGIHQDGAIYIFGSDNLYVCNIATPPRSILNFKGNSTITAKPTSPSQITRGRGSIYWTDGNTTSGQIYAYGSLIPGTPKIFYQPYTSASSDPLTALGFNGTNFFGADSHPNMQIFNAGTARNNASIKLA
ncbi:MAG TPA: hypothetical protein VMR98_03145, partial [Candidatus Polarisedimenticolaceae bacterium]|nr:hypothetical protein [Candidatus Polarisedimenticolaceae bacterium]